MYICDPKEQDSHSLRLPAPGICILLPKRYMDAQIWYKDYDQLDGKALDAFFKPTASGLDLL